MGRTARFVVFSSEVEVPDNVDIEIQGKVVKVKGPKGEITKDFSHARNIVISKDGNKVYVKAYMGRSKDKALVNTVASHINNMIVGVTKGYRYYLKIVFTHFPMNVSVEGDKVVIKRFLGGQDTRVARILPGVKVTVKDRDVIVEGIDIEKVGQTAANIEQAVRVKDKDRRVFIDGIYIYKKEVIQ